MTRTLLFRAASLALCLTLGSSAAHAYCLIPWAPLHYPGNSIERRSMPVYLYAPDGMFLGTDAAVAEHEVRRAVDSWFEESAAHVRLYYAGRTAGGGDSGRVVVRSYEAPGEVCGQPYARCFVPNVDYIPPFEFVQVGGTIWFDDGIDFSEKPAAIEGFRKILVHELGHALGLDDLTYGSECGVFDGVMGNHFLRHIGLDDKLGLRALYGAGFFPLYYVESSDGTDWVRGDPANGFVPFVYGLIGSAAAGLAWERFGVFRDGASARVVSVCTSPLCDLDVHAGGRREPGGDEVFLVDSVADLLLAQTDSGAPSIQRDLDFNDLAGADELVAGDFFASGLGVKDTRIELLGSYIADVRELERVTDTRSAMSCESNLITVLDSAGGVETRVAVEVAGLFDDDRLPPYPGEPDAVDPPPTFDWDDVVREQELLGLPDIASWHPVAMASGNSGEWIVVWMGGDTQEHAAAAVHYAITLDDGLSFAQTGQIVSSDGGDAGGGTLVRSVTYDPATGTYVVALLGGTAGRVLAAIVDVVGGEVDVGAVNLGIPTDDAPAIACADLDSEYNCMLVWLGESAFRPLHWSMFGVLDGQAEIDQVNETSIRGLSTPSVAATGDDALPFVMAAKQVEAIDTWRWSCEHASWQDRETAVSVSPTASILSPSLVPVRSLWYGSALHLRYSHFDY